MPRKSTHFMGTVGGSGSVTSIATTAPVAGGTITTTGTISITGAAGQVLAGATPAFTATPVLGVAGSTVGTVGLQNATSGTLTVSPPAGALGTPTLTLPAATDTLVGKATTDTLSNKTLTAASNANSITLLNYQSAIAPITGTGALATMYSYTLPGATMGAGKGIRFTMMVNHTTGSTNTQYRLNVGAANLSFSATGTSITAIALFMNNIGVTNAQQFLQFPAFAASAVLASSQGATTSAIDSTANIAITWQFNVANTDAVTPQMFMVELIA